jgi:multidrug efflux pump subunit AcrA (membrane-fusion protein)
MRRNVFVLLVLSAAMLASCWREKAAPSPGDEAPLVKARVESVSKRAINAPYEAVGTVKSKFATTVRSKLVAHVVAVHAHEGDVVKTGDLLAELDDREVAAQVQKAEGALAEARKAREEINSAVDAAASAQVAASANKDLADATYARYKGLLENSAVSRQMYDETEAKQRAAAAEALRVGDMFRSTSAKKGEVEARIEQAKAEVANSQVALGFTKITAPINGFVSMKHVDVGDLASPDAALFDIEDNEQYRLEAAVDEAQSGRVHAGDQAVAVLDALGGAELPGTVGEIVPTADSASRTFVVKLDLPKDQRLRSGMFGRLRLSIGEKEILAVPKSAVFERGQLAGVYVVAGDGVARLRLIKTGKQYDDLVEVLSGLNEGDRIVVDNVAEVADGCRIEGGN